MEPCKTAQHKCYFFTIEVLGFVLMPFLLNNFMKLKYIKFLIPLILLLFCKDMYSVAYNRSAHYLRIETDKHIIFHYRDNMERSDDARSLIRYCDYNLVFNDSINNYSYIALLDKTTKDTIFKKACPAFRNILSYENKYIIGLSSVNLIVFDLKGNLLFNKSLIGYNAQFNTHELKNLASTHPCHFQKIVDEDKILQQDSLWYIKPDFSQRSNNDSTSLYFLYRKKRVENKYFSLFPADCEFEKIKIKIYETKEGAVEKVGIFNCDSTMDLFNKHHKPLGLDYFIENNIIINTKNDCIDSIPENKCKKYELKPRLHVQIGDLHDYCISMEQILGQNTVEAIYPSSNYDSLHFEVDSFYISFYHKIRDKRKYKMFMIEGNRIPNRVKRKIRRCKEIKEIYIEPIVALVTQEGRDARLLGTLRYKIFGESEFKHTLFNRK